MGNRRDVTVEMRDAMALEAVRLIESGMSVREALKQYDYDEARQQFGTTAREFVARGGCCLCRGGRAVSDERRVKLVENRGGWTQCTCDQRVVGAVWGLPIIVHARDCAFWAESPPYSRLTGEEGAPQPAPTVASLRPPDGGL